MLRVPDGVGSALVVPDLVTQTPKNPFVKPSAVLSSGTLFLSRELGKDRLFHVCFGPDS